MGYSCAPFGGRNVPYSHSLPRSIRRALLKFGERTLATAGSDDFTDDDFFPDLGNLFLNDMGDNLNANGVAPVASYVFLSFLFEIMVEFMFLVYVLDSICSATMLVRMISLISVLAIMICFVVNLVVTCSYIQLEERPLQPLPFHGRPGRCLQGALRLLLSVHIAILGLAGKPRASPHATVRRSLLARGEEHQVRDVLTVHRAGVAGGSAPPASLGGGRQRLPLDRGHRRGPRRPPPRLCSVRQGR